MGKLERITVTMPEEMAAKLRAAVDSGSYATTSEIVRDALRDWNDQQDRKEVSLAKLRASIDEAEKGPFLDGPTVLAELEDFVAELVRKGETDQAA
jgi:antitoxin ParD1/3/4